MKLSNVTVSTREAELPFVNFPDFKVKVGYISRELLRKINKDSTINKYDENLQITTPEVDPDLFLKNYAQHALKGWSGLTPEILGQLILVDEDALRAEMGEATEVEFNLDNAMYLMRQCAMFDRWVTESCTKLSLFRK